MRLVCPNCDAEYEVDASAIPDAGRDVQCSNCGHAWFQLSPRMEDELATETALFDPPPALDTPAPSAPVTEGPATPPPAPRALDESVLAVLREEAERESTARRNEAPPPIETQTELGLSDVIAATVAAASQPDTAEPDPAEPAHEPDPVAQRVARMKGIDPTPAKPQSRRDMLPEVEEINTTLRASSERRPGDAGAVSDSLSSQDGKSAFRSGFLLVMVVAVLIVVLYVMAPKLAQQIPGLKGPLASYVAAIDEGRLWLDATLRGAIGMMRGGSTAP